MLGEEKEGIMKRRTRFLTAIILSAAMIFSSMSLSFAEEITDISAADSGEILSVEDESNEIIEAESGNPETPAFFH